MALTTGTSPGEGPVDVDLLLLSALGASVNIQGAWTPGPNSGIDLASWWHRASIGRDSYVRVVDIGYLFPWGNRAVRITISDREIQVDSNGDAVAYLVQKQYIVVTEPQVTYAGDPFEPYGGRGNPIRNLLVKTVTTPPDRLRDLDRPRHSGRRLLDRRRLVGAQRRHRRPVLLRGHRP